MQVTVKSSLNFLFQEKDKDKKINSYHYFMPFF